MAYSFSLISLLKVARPLTLVLAFKLVVALIFVLIELVGPQTILLYFEKPIPLYHIGTRIFFIE